MSKEERGTQERENKRRGAAAPLWIPHSAPTWGRPAWPPALWRRRAAPTTSKGGGGGCPLNRTEEGALPPSCRERKRGACPLSDQAQGPRWAPGRPRPSAGRRRRPSPGVDPATPKGRGKRESWVWVFVVVVDLGLVVVWRCGGGIGGDGRKKRSWVM